MSTEQTSPTPPNNEDQTEKILETIEKARETYNKPPYYDVSLAQHPVYLRAPSLFEKMVNNWDMADGTDLLNEIVKSGLKIADVTFTDWGHRDKSGTAMLLKPKMFLFNAQENAIEVIDSDDKFHIINIQQYGVPYPHDIQTPDRGISIRISGGVKQDIAVGFTLNMPGTTQSNIEISQTDHLTSSETDEPETPRTGQEFGGIKIPVDWQVDAQGKYASTTKTKALEFFNEKAWTPLMLQEAAIKARTSGSTQPIFFVTGGWASYFWDTATNVTVQKVQAEQIDKEFARDIPEGKFFMKKTSVGLE